ncbi:MAG TPA: pyruvate dehydrogenase (acetyl-transferring), homodimeric type, partial [Deinococcales bacterium]|nr:pyruvate dehydrogenase (acetyl-transferring), homodimeric type [Deinococcales bacterium]
MADNSGRAAVNARAALGEDQLRELEAVELQEWLDSLDYVLDSGGSDRALDILQRLRDRAAASGVAVPFRATTPYINTIPVEEQPEYPGDLEIERRIRHLLRWNGMAMVTRANDVSPGIGGHIASYAS